MTWMVRVMETSILDIARLLSFPNENSSVCACHSNIEASSSTTVACSSPAVTRRRSLSSLIYQHVHDSTLSYYIIMSMKERASTELRVDGATGVCMMLGSLLNPIMALEGDHDGDCLD